MLSYYDKFTIQMLKSYIWWKFLAALTTQNPAYGLQPRLIARSHVEKLDPSAFMLSMERKLFVMGTYFSLKAASQTPLSQICFFKITIMSVIHFFPLIISSPGW